MACNFTIKDVKNQITNELIDFDGVSKTPSGVFFNFDIENPHSLSDELIKGIKDLRKKYQKNTYGEIIKTSKSEYGINIDITPTQQLADALTERAELEDLRKELGDDFYMGDEALRSQNEFYQKTQNIPNEGQVASEKTIRDLAARMSDRIGIPVRFESDRTKDYKGKLENGTAVINLAYATLDTPIHEILGHPIIRAIKNTDISKRKGFNLSSFEIKKDYKNNTWYIDFKPGYYREEFKSFLKTGFTDRKSAENSLKNNYSELYQNLLKELEYGRGKEILNRIKRDYNKKFNGEWYVSGYGEHLFKKDGTIDGFKPYNNEQGKYKIVVQGKVLEFNNRQEALNYVYYTPEEQQEEAIVELLGLMTAEKLDAVKDGKLISLLKRLLKEIKVFMKDILFQKEVEINKLPDNMTINDLADLLAYSNSKLILPGYEVEYTTPDNQQFKTYAEASNHISELAKSVEDVDLSDTQLPIRKKVEKANDIPVDKFTDEFDNTIYNRKEGKWFIEDTNRTMLDDDIVTLWNSNLSDNYINKAGVEGFIEKNKEYEQSKEIIEEWKKINNIQYNPEEIYSRGQEFVSVVGAYSDFDVNLMMQNLLSHIEDNEKAGGKFAISAYTKPIDKQIGHLEGGGGKIKFKLYPQSNDILWAANTDVYSGSVWDASEKVNKDKKSELLGVSYTKYPSLSNVNTVQPNLAAIVDDLNHHHNELGIVLTGNNFRLEYDEDIPYQTKKIIDSINSILDQKYGKLVKPDISKKILKSEKSYEVRWKNGTLLGRYTDYNKAKEALKGEYTDSQGNKIKPEDAIEIVEGTPIEQIGIQPTQTNETLKESIESVWDNYNKTKRYKDSGEIGWRVTNNKGESTDIFTDKIKAENQLKLREDELEEGWFLEKVNIPEEKEYTSQALINTKIAKLKEVAKKYPRTLITSKVVPISKFDDTVQYEMFDVDEVPFQKISSTNNIFNSRYSSKQLGESNTENNNQQPVGDNYVEFVRYKKAQLEDIEKKKERVKSNLRFKDTSEERAKLKQLDKLEIEIKNQLEILSTNQVDYMFHAILEDLTGLEQALKDFNIHNVQDVKNKIDYYSNFLKELIVENHEDFDAISGKVARLTSMYDNLIKDKVIQQLEESSLVQELLANENEGKEDTDKITIEDLLQANSDISWLDRTFLGLISSTTGDTILPQLLMSEFRKKLYDKQNRVFTLIDKLNSFIKRTGMEDFDWVFSKDKSGNKNGYLVDLYSDKWFAEWKNRNSRLKQYYNSLADANIDTKTTYTNLVNWYKTNTHIIDFTRLSAVKEIFGDQYAEHFTYDDEAIYAYEENLKKQLGPKFEETVEKVINKLQKFEELKETDSEFKERNIASHNIWEFLKSYKAGFPNQISYTYGEDNKPGKVYFASFNDLSVLPKSKTTKVVTTDTQRRQEEVDTGFYSGEFQDILGDSNKVEYWSILREMSKYINSTYHLDEQARLSYPKIRTEYAERILEDIKTIRKSPNTFGKVGSMFHDMLHEYKSFFYEKGQNKNDSGVVSNYADSSRREISELAKTYMLRGISKKDAYEKATAIVIKEYSTDINTAFKGMLLEAALHDTRLEIAPMAQGILNVYKNIETVDGKERKFGIQRLEGYINKIILNNNEKQRGNTQVGGSDLSRDSLLSKFNDITVKFSKGKVSNAERTKLLTDIEKNIVKELKVIQEQGYEGEFKIQDLDYVLQRVYLEDTQDYIYNYNGAIVSKEEFDKNFQEYITKKISSIGLDLNVAGLIDGSLKTIIFKELGLNPISGIFNRVEGKHSALIMDLTGEYWTPGNIDIANQMMAFSNLKKMLPKRLTENMKGKKEQIEIFDLLVKKLGTLQDRKNELQKNVDASKLNKESLNIFKWAVEHPEFKNQGAIMLAIMMDTKIKDNDGNEHTIIDKETGKFNPFIIEGGILKVKPEFEDSFKFESDEVANLVLRLEDAVSHSQGNYNQYDIMLAKKNIWGRAGTLFMTWFPEHFNQRWGLRGDNNYNLFTGKKRKEGRFVAGYKANKANFLAYMLGVLGISYGAIGMSGLIGAGLMGAYVYNKFLKNIANTETIKRDVNYIKEMIEFLKSIAIESLNYPSRIGSSVPGLNRLRIKNNSFQGTNMTSEEIASMQAMTRELGIMLTLLSIKLAIAAMTYNDDDDEESEQRMRHNFLQNQLNRSITSIATFTNPQSLASDNSRIAFVSYLTDLWKTLDHTILNPKADKIGQDVLNITPVPRMISKALTGTAPWEDKADYTELPDNNGLTKPLKWTTDLVKDNATDGEFTAKREYKKERDKIVDELKDELIDKYGDNKEVLKMILDRKVKAKIGTKYKGLNYKQALESIENDERMVDPKSKKGSKATRAERNKFKEKLKEEGLNSSEISKIMAEEFRGR